MELASSRSLEGAGVLSDLVVCYLFLGGAGAGLVLVLCVLGLLSPRESVAVAVRARRGSLQWRMQAPMPYQRLFGAGFATACVVLFLGATCLLADLGNMGRATLLFLSPRPTLVTVGAWSLGVSLVLSLVLGLIWYSVGSWMVQVVRTIEVVAGAAAIVVMGYTGLLLQSLAAVPLWFSPWLVALFLASSLSCGIGLTLAVSCITGSAPCFRTLVRWLAAVDAVLIVVEGCCAAAFVASVAAAGGVGADGTSLAVLQSLQELLGGDQAWLFWIGFVLAGLGIPLVFDGSIVIRRYSLAPASVLFAAACVLAGGFVMRACIVNAGMHPLLMFAGS